MVRLCGQTQVDVVEISCLDRIVALVDVVVLRLCCCMVLYPFCCCCYPVLPPCRICLSVCVLQDTRQYASHHHVLTKFHVCVLFDNKKQSVSHRCIFTSVQQSNKATTQQSNFTISQCNKIDTVSHCICLAQAPTPYTRGRLEFF